MNTSTPDGYAEFFYELGALMGVPAQSLPPATVWKEQMLPRLSAALVATKAEPVIWVSLAQAEAIQDEPDSEHGTYLPARKTQAGMFTLALYAEPQATHDEKTSATAEPDDTPLETGEGDAR